MSTGIKEYVTIDSVEAFEGFPQAKYRVDEDIDGNVVICRHEGQIAMVIYSNRTYTRTIDCCNDDLEDFINYLKSTDYEEVNHE